MRRGRYILPIVFTTLSMGGAAQQTPTFSQYITNGFVINPAMAGLDGSTRINLSVHDYLMGIKNAPMTISASVNGRVLKRRLQTNGSKPSRRSGRIGLGGLIFNDLNGLMSRLGMQFTYAYHIDFWKSQLSLGISGSIAQTRINARSLDFHDDEPLLRNGFSNMAYVPDAVLGILYRRGKHYAGLTVANLFQRSLHIGEFDYNYTVYRHYFFQAGTSIKLGHDWTLDPSLLAKAAANSMYQGEIGARLFYRDDAWVALSYRTPNIASAMIGVRAGKIYIGYAYEYTFSPIQTVGKGSQEVCLTYRLGSSERRERTQIRY